jgi:hypothetical protein
MRGRGPNIETYSLKLLIQESGIDPEARAGAPRFQWGASGSIWVHLGASARENLTSSKEVRGRGPKIETYSLKLLIQESGIDPETRSGAPRLQFPPLKGGR